MEMQPAGLQPPRELGRAGYARANTPALVMVGRWGVGFDIRLPGATAAQGPAPRPRKRMTPETLIRLKLLAALVAFAAGIGAVVTVVLLAQSTPSGSSGTGPQAAPAVSSAPTTTGTASFPSPPAGALALAREDRRPGRRPGRFAAQGPARAAGLGPRAPDQPVRGLSVSSQVDPVRRPGRGRAARAATAASIALPAPQARARAGPGAEPRPASAVELFRLLGGPCQACLGPLFAPRPVSRHHLGAG